MQILCPTQPFFYYSSFGNQKSNTAIFFLGYNLETLNPTQLLFLGDLLEVLYPTQPLFLGIFWKSFTQHSHFSWGSFGNPEPNTTTFLVDLLKTLNPTDILHDNFRHYSIVSLFFLYCIKRQCLEKSMLCYLVSRPKQ